MPYSAVTQPWPLPRRKGGIRSSTDAVTSTRVSPKPTRQLPSAWRVKPGSMVIGRIWSAARADGRIDLSPQVGAALALPSPWRKRQLDKVHGEHPDQRIDRPRAG